MEFGRQGHSSNFYVGFCPTWTWLLTSTWIWHMASRLCVTWQADIPKPCLGYHPHLMKESVDCRTASGHVGPSLPGYAHAGPAPYDNLVVWQWHSMLVIVRAQGPCKNWYSHIDASLSRQPLVKGERLVRFEVNAVIVGLSQKKPSSH